MANIRNLAALAALGAAGAMAMRDRKDKPAPVEDREKPKDKAETKPVAAAKEDAAVINASSDDDSFSRDLASERLSAKQNKGITTNARGEAVPMRRAAPKVAPVATAPAAATPAAPVAVSPAAAAVSANPSDMPPYRSVRPIRRGTDNVSAATMAEAASTDKEPSLSLPPYRSVRPMRRGEEMKSGGTVKKMASGGSVSARGDGIAQRGKTKGRFV